MRYPASLADTVAERSQKKTKKYDKRPYGVGLLLIGAGSDGVKLYETCPSGQNWEYNAQAIGRRSQAGKAYLEQHLDEFMSCGRDELIKHALRALADCQTKEENDLESIAVGVVGLDEPFTILVKDQLLPYLERQ